jgi:hypothetical protein
MSAAEQVSPELAAAMADAIGDNDNDDAELRPAVVAPPWPPPQKQSQAEVLRILNAMAAAGDLSGRPRKYDVWVNPLDVPQRATFQGPVKHARTSAGLPTQSHSWLTLTWAPGARIALDRSYRRSLQTTHDGQIIGGQAPMLRRENATATPLHPAIVPVSEEQALADRTHEEAP